MTKTIPLFQVAMSKDAVETASYVLGSGYVSQGPMVEEFEKRLQNRLDTPHLVTTNSATSAEHLILHMMRKNIPPTKNEILATPLTCTATNWPILANGYDIKWVDIDPKTLNICLDDLEKKITHKTAGIMFVHWGGTPVSLDSLDDILNKKEDQLGYRPFVIEDCAHAFGTETLERLRDKHNNYRTYSFQAIKHLCAGDGGALVLTNKEEYKRAKLLRWYGIDRENNSKDFRVEDDIKEWGFKFHMNDINAGIGIGNLKEIDNIISKHKSNAAFYQKHLKNVKGVSLYKYNPYSSYWIYTLYVENRAAFMKHMEKKGIIVSRVHERNDRHSCVNQYKTNLPNLDKVCEGMICIPVGWWVTEEDREYIVGAIKEGWGND